MKKQELITSIYKDKIELSFRKYDFKKKLIIAFAIISGKVLVFSGPIKVTSSQNDK